MASSILEDVPQRDGRRAIRERHVFGDYSEDVCYLAGAADDASAMLAVHAGIVAKNRTEAEFSRVVKHVASGASLQSFPFAALTISTAARRLLKLLATAENPRAFQSYAALVAATPTANVAALLGVTQTKAGRIKTWAQSVSDSITSQDVSKASVSDVIAEAGL